MNFIRDFLNYVEKVGIFDEYDRDTNKMKTSAGVEALIKEARSYLPPKLKGIEAAAKMRDLDPDMRDQLIQQDEEKRIIDMRTEFARRQAENGGAQGLLKRLVDAVERGDTIAVKEVHKDALGIVKGGEHV